MHFIKVTEGKVTQITDLVKTELLDNGAAFYFIFAFGQEEDALVGLLDQARCVGGPGCGQRCGPPLKSRLLLADHATKCCTSSM